MRLLSPGFACALVGVGITIASWFSPWAWPAWPALFVLNILEPRYSYPDGSAFSRAVAVVTLIAVNVAVWGIVCRVIWRAARPHKNTA